MTNPTCNKLFPLQLWLLTIVVGPMLLGIASVLDDPGYFNNPANMGVVLVFIPFGVFFSLPTFLIVWLAFLLAPGKLSAIIVKLVLMVIAIAGVIVTFWLIDGSMAQTLTIAYSAAVIISGLFFKVQKRGVPAPIP